MRNLYRAMVAAVICLPIFFIVAPIIRYIPHLTTADIFRAKIALFCAAFIFAAYVVYYLESATQRQVPIPISDTSLEVAAAAQDVFSTCLQTVGSYGKVIHVDSNKQLCVVDIGHRRRPTLRMTISVAASDLKSSVVKIRSHSRAIFYPFDKSDNARAVLALRGELRAHFDVPRRSRYDPDNLHW